MNLQVAYLLLVVGVVALLLGLATHAWRRRHGRHGRWFAAFCVLAACWTVLIGVMAISPPWLARWWLSVKYLFIGGTTIAMFAFVARYTGRGHLAERWPLRLLLVLPILGHLGSLQDGWGMVRDVVFASDRGLTYIPTLHFGPLYWVVTGSLYLLIAISLGMLVVEAASGSSLARRQAPWLIVGVAAPFVASVLLITEVFPRLVDPMPLGLGVAGLSLWWGAFRHGVMDLVPMARNALVDALRDAMVIVDGDGRVVDTNLAMQHIAGPATAGWVGRPFAECLPVDSSLHPVAQAAGRGGAAPVELAGKNYDVRVIEVASADTPRAARVIVLHDVTHHQRLIGELQQALSEVQTLRGLLPICAECKQIRDEAGAWHPLESFIGARTGAAFSHGMCPGCADRWETRHFGAPG